jgi:hypothetical protein
MDVLPYVHTCDTCVCVCACAQDLEMPIFTECNIILMFKNPLLTHHKGTVFSDFCEVELLLVYMYKTLC